MTPRLADISVKKSKAKRTAYIDLRLVDPASGCDGIGGILTDGETIVDLGPQVTRDSVPCDASVIDATGLIAIPGLVDLRAHLREPGFEHQETIHTASRSAAVGGITSIACMPTTRPTIDDVSLVHFIERRARETSLVKIHPIAAVTQGREGRQLTELGLLGEAGALGFCDGPRPIMNANVLCRALSYGTVFDSLIMHHAEDTDLTGDGVMNSGETATRLGLEGMPPEAEAIMVARDIRLVEMTGGRLHFSNITTAESVDLVRRAKARGLPVSADTAPHYLVLNESAVGDYLSFTKVRPPLRAEEDRQALVAALAEGVIDAVVSAHEPRDQDSKRQPFSQAAFGIVGLETLLALVLEIVGSGRIGLMDALALVTCRPAALLGLQAGRLVRGGPADIVLVDPSMTWQIDNQAFQSKSKNSPFDGRTVTGRVVRTVVSGRTVMEIAPAP